jgi:phenylacetate-CoA ligase
VQHGLTDIEVRLVLNGPMEPSIEANLLETIRRDLHPGFEIKLNYVDAIARSAGGKHEDFISAIPD